MNPSVNLTTFIHYGVVEERCLDKRHLGRCRVRIIGLHTEDKIALPTHDLPWAYPITPITSASVSGIGETPLGVVEGTWCLIVFRDEYKQQPLILGTLPGIPFKRTQEPTNQTSGELITESGVTVTDSSGAPISAGDSQQTAQRSEGTKKVSQISISAEGKAAIKTHERLSSLVKGRNTWGNDSTPNQTLIYSYKDSGGVWTIGWGNTILQSGESVTDSTTITKSQADALFDTKIQEFVAGAKRNIKVPVTQSMFDAVVSMMYNAGIGGISSSQFMSALNSGDYAAAAALITTTRHTVGGVVNAGLVNRRASEKRLFLRDGLPSGPGVIEQSQQPQQTRQTSNPAVKAADKVPQQSQSQSQNSSVGFVDPSLKYPKKEWLGEPDLHRLARHEKINETIVAVKEAARVTNIPAAFGVVWSQPRVPYNAKYPYNKVKETESGHTEEWDDTPGSERTHRYHKSGTFEEVDRNGTKVSRIVGDNFEILERNGHVLVKGSCFVTILGDSRVLVENDAYLEVRGNAKTSITGNWDVGVGGTVNIHSGGTFAVDAPEIHWNSGVASGVTVPTTGSSGKHVFGELQLPTRTGDIDSNYETPEEGSPDEFNSAQISAGVYSEEDLTKAPTENQDITQAEQKPPASNVITGCDGISDQTISPSLVLSNNFTLGKLSVGQSGIPQPGSVHYGIPAAKIVCNMQKLAVNVLDPIKLAFPNMFMTSVWRSEQVNNRCGGSKKSDHLTGCAADIQFSGFTREQTYKAAIEIQKMLPTFKQIILEYKGSSTWIHVSYQEGSNKNQSLTMDASSNKIIASGSFVLK